jgi:hypothetical protein
LEEHFSSFLLFFILNGTRVTAADTGIFWLFIHLASVTPSSLRRLVNINQKCIQLSHFFFFFSVSSVLRGFLSFWLSYRLGTGRPYRFSRHQINFSRPTIRKLQTRVRSYAIKLVPFRPIFLLELLLFLLSSIL